MIKLGDAATDKISGFTGVVIGKCEYLNGCIQFLVAPKGLHDCEPIKSQWFDIQRLEDIVSNEIPGGPERSHPRI